MKIETIKQYVKKSDRLKKAVHRFIMHPTQTRPNWWIRLFQFTYLKKGKGSHIYRSVRLDLPPFNRFSLGRNAVIEDFSCINNAVGDVMIGDDSRIGLSNTLIGPITIGNHVHMAQNVVASGLNHNYQDITQTIDRQGVTTLQIVIDNNVWIGANAVILAGTHIGKHSIIAAGSVVKGDIPDYCMCAGVPAKIIKRYNFETNQWEKSSH